jgi:hypothetical protein
MFIEAGGDEAKIYVTCATCDHFFVSGMIAVKCLRCRDFHFVSRDQSNLRWVAEIILFLTGEYYDSGSIDAATESIFESLLVAEKELDSGGIIRPAIFLDRCGNCAGAKRRLVVLWQ